MKPYEIVILAVVGFLALISSLLILGKAKVRIVCREKLRVVLYVLGIPITLVSDRKKEPKLIRNYAIFLTFACFHNFIHINILLCLCLNVFCNRMNLS